MSALRLSVPGYPTRLIDEGPATPHRIHGYSVPVSVVGSMEAFVSTAYGENRPKPEKPPRAFSIHPEKRPTCGAIMRVVGAPCARMPGHRSGNGGGHRSAEAMRDDARARRTGQRAPGQR